MASTTTTPVDTDAVATEVYNLRDRIVPLLKEGNTDAAAELAKEAETIISDNLKGGTRVIVQLKRTLRTSISDAMKTEATPEATTPAEATKADAIEPTEVATSTEVVLAKAAEVAENTAEIDALVAKGAEQISNIADNKLNGAKRIAEILLDMRRRMIVDGGVPDIMGTSKLAKDKSKEMYNRVLSALPPKGQNEAADNVRSELNKLKKDVQNAMVTVRALYLRGLDGTGEEAENERKLYANAITEGSNRPASEQVAEFYGGVELLKTQAEIAKEARERKAAEAAKAKELSAQAETSESDTESEGEAPSDEPEMTIAQLVRAFIDKTWRGLDSVGQHGPALIDSMNNLEESEREALIKDAETAWGALGGLIKVIKGEVKA